MFVNAGGNPDSYCRVGSRGCVGTIGNLMVHSLSWVTPADHRKPPENNAVMRRLASHCRRGGR